MNTEPARFLAALLDNLTIKGFQCAAGNFLGAQTSIAGHIRAIWPPLLVGSSRLAVKVERALPDNNRPPVRPKAKRLRSTGLANTGRRSRLTLDRRTGLKYGKMAIVLGLALYRRAGQQCRKRCKGPPGQFGRG